jgi:hypothetical protein
VGKKGGGGGVDTPGGIVGRVKVAADIACVKGAQGGSGEGVDAPENSVDLGVAAAALPPALDDANVVSEDLEVTAWSRACDKVTDEEFEANGFCPANVPTVTLPARKEAPGPPTGTDSDCDTNA